MTFTRNEVTAGELGQLEVFEDLVRGLSAEDLDRPTRCTGWTVRNVAAHVIGTIADVTAGRLEGQGTPEVTERQVRERDGRTADELADELAGARKLAADLLGAFDDTAWNAPLPTGFDGTLGAGIEALWYDTFVHGDDIRAALGLASIMTTPELHIAVHHIAKNLTKRGWGPATLALTGLPEIEIGSGGTTVTGDPLAFILAATGRADAATVGLSPDVNIYA